MSFQLNPPKEQIADFEAVISIPVESLSKLIPCTTTGRIMRPQELEEAFVSVPGIERDVAQKLIRTLLSLLALCRQVDMEVETCLAGMREGLARGGWDAARLKEFDLRSQIYAKLLKEPNVRRVSTSLSVAYEYENFFQSARIMTDIRPVFDIDATGIEGTLITHTLRLRYDDDATEHAISVAMDLVDIKKLREQCDRAISKAKVASDFMNHKAEVVSIIAGDVD